MNHMITRAAKKRMAEQGFDSTEVDGGSTATAENNVNYGICNADVVLAEAEKVNQSCRLA